jgi:recombination protein RecT
MAEEKKLPAVQKDITDDVLKKINKFKETGELAFPENYSPENALKSAMLILSETETKDNKPVLEYCTRPSIANALLEMVITGLNPMKKQCDFVAYGKKLTMQREYHGTIALAKRYGGVKEANANVIYQGDIFKYEVDPLTGKKKIIEHQQDFKNIDDEKITGAYAVLTFNDDSTPYVEIMNMNQIRKAWLQGYAKGNSPAHRNFPGEMSKKTVIGRACKLFISSSDDSALALAERVTGKKYDNPIEDIDAEDVTVQAEIQENANKEELNMNDDAPDSTEQPEPGTKKEPEKLKEQSKQQFKAGF